MPRSCRCASRAWSRRRSAGLSKGQVRRRWFPKVKVTILEPVKLTVDPELKGRKRRLAAGAALYGIMSDLVFRTTSTDRTVIGSGDRGRRHARPQPGRGRGSRHRRAHLQAAARRRRHPRQQAHADGGGGTRRRRHAAERQRRGRHHPRPDDGGARAGHDQFHRRRGEHSRRLQGGAGRYHPHVAHVHREGQAHQPGRGDREQRSGSSISKTFAPASPSATRSAACSTPRSRWSRASPTTGPRSCSRRARRACRKGVVLSHRNMLANAAQAAARIDFGCEDKVFNVLPVFHSFGLTVGVVLPLVSGVRIYLYPSPLHYRTVAELIYARERHHHVRHRHVPRRLCAGGASLRLPLAALHPGRRRAGEGSDPPDLHGEIRAAHSRRLRRHRDRAGARPQHADVQQVRHGRTHPARHGGAPGKGRGRRGGRPPVRARSERDARLSQGRKSRRARTAGRRLARHRRHRHHRRTGLRHHQGTRQAVRQDRRRNDLARRGRGAGGRTVAE